jgi:hypothetical protein
LCKQFRSREPPDGGFFQLKNTFNNQKNDNNMKNNILNLKLFGKEKKVALQFGKYNNGTIALEALKANGEPLTTCSVNWEQNWEGLTPYKQTFKFPTIVIKSYSENEGIADALINAGVLTKKAYMANTNGGVVVGLLTKAWQEIALAQLEKLKD